MTNLLRAKDTSKKTSPEVSSPEPAAKKENPRKPKAETNKEPKNAKQSQPDSKTKGSSMASLNDLPSLGGKKPAP